MTRKNILILILAFYSSYSFCQAPATLTKIVLIRHGEKSESGDNLSCTGLNRSLQLPAVLIKKFGMFNTVFVPTLKAGNSTTHSRMFQTITPYLVKENLSVSSKFDEADVNGLAAAIRKQTGTVLVVWEHKNLRKIAKALGLQDVQKWDDSDFDSIWIITYKKGVPMLTSDKEGLNPSSVCN